MSLHMDERGVIVSCRNCGRRNRVPFAAKLAKCGGCQSALDAVNQPIESPSTAAFDALIATAAVPVIVDFWAPWCGPCRVVAPELERMAASNGGKYLVVKVNTDALPDLGERYRIRSIPTMAVFERGSEIARTAGARPAADIDAFVSQSLTTAHARS